MLLKCSVFSPVRLDYDVLSVPRYGELRTAETLITSGKKRTINFALMLRIVNNEPKAGGAWLEHQLSCWGRLRHSQLTMEGVITPPIIDRQCYNPMRKARRIGNGSSTGKKGTLFLVPKLVNGSLGCIGITIRNYTSSFLWIIWFIYKLMSRHMQSLMWVGNAHRAAPRPPLRQRAIYQ